MLVSMIELMKTAREGGYCVPAPAVENENTACARASTRRRVRIPPLL